MTIGRDLGLRVVEQHVPREMLYIADEVFFAGTAVEVTPIRSVDKIPVGNGKRGPITAALQKAYFDIINCAAPDRHGWLRFLDTKETAATAAARRA
jgi:branched-chain amino acid aminotransferase